MDRKHIEPGKLQYTPMEKSTSPRIQELEREIELAKELIELRKQLAMPYPYPVQVPYVWDRPFYVGDYTGKPIITTTGNASDAISWSHCDGL